MQSSMMLRSFPFTSSLWKETIVQSRWLTQLKSLATYSARQPRPILSNNKGQKARDLKRMQSEGRQRKIKSLASVPGSKRYPQQAHKHQRDNKKQSVLPKTSPLEHEIREMNKSEETAILASGQNPAFETSQSTALDGFKDLGLSDALVEGMDTKRVSFPTAVQRLTIPRVLQGENVICAAQTGSGKTLAYLAPIIQALKDDEESGFIRRPARPRACIILPVRELALQTLNVMKSLSYYTPLKSEVIAPGRRRKWIKENVADTVDIVIGTPKEVLFYRERSRIYFTDIQFLVLDEADTLFDPGFRSDTLNIIRGIMSSNRTGEHRKSAQCILTMATFPREEILNTVQDFIPNINIATAGLHKVMPHVTHKFMKTLSRHKPALLMKYIDTHVKGQGKKVMVFTNNTRVCAWISHVLREANINHVAVHGDVKKQERTDAWKSLMDHNCRLIVCTDLASRGLDTSDVSVVINYDCPMSITDYLHRAGRTGRVGALYDHQPEVHTWITGFREATLAAKIKMAASKNEALRQIEIRKLASREEKREKKEV